MLKILLNPGLSAYRFVLFSRQNYASLNKKVGFIPGREKQRMPQSRSVINLDWRGLGTIASNAGCIELTRLLSPKYFFVCLLCHAFC